jgi:Flp pilus assembly protein TadD
LNLAYALSLQGNFRAAYNELQELLRRHPEEPRAHNNMGILLMKQGKLNEAVSHFSKALALRPNYRQARLNLEEARHSLEGERGSR